MWGCGGDSAVQPHSMCGVRGRGGTHTHTHRNTHTHTEEHTHTHTQERTRECCTYPLAAYPMKSARRCFPLPKLIPQKRQFMGISAQCPHVRTCPGERSARTEARVLQHLTVPFGAAVLGRCSSLQTTMKTLTSPSEEVRPLFFSVILVFRRASRGEFALFPV